MALRPVSHVTTTPDEEQAILVAQRKNRPTSPHLEIWKPEVNFVLSASHRILGVAMAGAFYALTCGYAATSILGIDFTSATLVSAFSTLPLVVKLAAKLIMAYPFVFHSTNGIRHLIWDFGKELSIKGVWRTAYVVLGVTAVAGSYLAFLF